MAYFDHNSFFVCLSFFFFFETMRLFFFSISLLLVQRGWVVYLGSHLSLNVRLWRNWGYCSGEGEVNLICAMRLISSSINFNLSTHCFLAYLLSMKGNFWCRHTSTLASSGFSHFSVQPYSLCVVPPPHDDLVNFGRACVCAHAPRWSIRPFTCARAAGLLFV